MPLFIVPLLAQAMTFSAGDRTEVRARDTGAGQAIDITSRATGSLEIRSTRAAYGITYSPWISELAVGTNAETRTVQHAVTLHSELKLSPRTTAYFAESLAFGQQAFSLAPLNSPTPPTGVSSTGASPAGASSDSPVARDPSAVSGPVATPSRGAVQRVRFGSTSTTLGLQHRLAASWFVNGQLGYSVSGGIGSQSRMQLPRYHVATAGLALAHPLSRRDRVSVSVDGSRVATGNDSLAYLLTASTTYQRQLTKLVSGGLTAGGAYSDFTTPNDSRVAVGPVGGASVRVDGTWRRAKVAVTLSEQFAPYVDRLTGTVTNRAATALESSWTKNGISVGATAQTSTTIGSNTLTANTLHYSYVIGETLGYRLRRHWEFELGCRQAWLRFSGMGSAPMMWTLFFAITYNTSNFRL